MMNSIAFSEQITDLAGQVKHLDICIGDIAACDGQTVDFLALSSFPDDYLPTPGSLVARLNDVV